MKFAHLADCHLGSWRQPELTELNFLSFQKAIDESINEKVDFVLITGDLFDSAYPSIEILKETFAEFKKLKDEKIKVYLIAGSHDYSVSGKTFLDVLEKAGFCEICKYEEKIDGETKKILLKPSINQTTSIYGYPGKKSGLEIPELKTIELEPTNNFTILMLHTTITEAKGTLPIDSVSLNNEVPKADYYALGHLHIDFHQEINGKPAIYGGPTFPNNFQEFEELKYGCFYIIEVNGFTQIIKKEIKIKDVLIFGIEIDNALTATQKIIAELEKHDLKDKIILLKLSGIIQQGKISDINFQEVKDYLDKKEIYSFLKNTGKLKTQEQELEVKIEEKEMEKIEEVFIEKYEMENPDKFNNFITPLLHGLDLQKQEDEKSTIFEQRLFSQVNKILNTNIKPTS